MFGTRILRHEKDMTTSVAPLCMFCKRYDKSSDALSCTAFPDGIPMTIIQSSVDHRKAVDGDHGLRFDPIDDKAVSYADDLFGK